MNTNISLLHNLFYTICSNDNVENLADDIKSGFSEFYDISEINMLYYDEKISKLRNVIKNFEPAQDYYSAEKMDILNEIFSKLNSSKFVLNDDAGLPDDIFDSETILTKTLSIALRYEGKAVGLLRLKFRNKTNLYSDDLKIFEIFSYHISLKMLNIILSKQLSTSSEFYKSIKDIAKIIETQYDFEYIIPIIGEILDKFVSNHLIYIFIKKEDKYNLYWPSACWNKKVYDLIEQLTDKTNSIISDDRKTGAFALVSEGEVIGCIVAHSTIDRLTDFEINCISELAKQSAITIERANTYSEILENATTDALTGLNNRRQFEKRLKEQYAIANRQDSPLCAIMTDIDFFKKFNDNYGHAVGDEVLKTTANVIKSQLREYDIPSRYGGEEFCILLPQTNLDEAKVVAERLRYAVEHAKIELNKTSKKSLNNLKITISVGLAQLDTNDLPEDLYMKADKALYDAKEDGRNKVVVYSKNK